MWGRIHPTRAGFMWGRMHLTRAGFMWGRMHLTRAGFMWGRIYPAGVAGCIWLAIFIALVLGSAGTAWAAEPLGRLFTSPQQRKQLDDLRAAIPQGEEITVPQFLSAETGESGEAEPAPGSGITVKGLVKREAGQGMAWINDSNTFEGDLASQYLKIESKDIQSGGVRISVPDQDEAINVKVGETYNPATGQVSDLAEPVATPAAPPAAVDNPAQP